MAATLAMSGGGQEEPFYPLQKDGVPLGLLLEDSLLFGLDCKVADKSVHNDFAQVRRWDAHTHDGIGGNGRGRLAVEAGLCWVFSDPRPPPGPGRSPLGVSLLSPPGQAEASRAGPSAFSACFRWPPVGRQLLRARLPSYQSDN